MNWARVPYWRNNRSNSGSVSRQAGQFVKKNFSTTGRPRNDCSVHPVGRE